MRIYECEFSPKSNPSYCSYTRFHKDIWPLMFWKILIWFDNIHFLCIKIFLQYIGKQAAPKFFVFSFCDFSITQSRKHHFPKNRLDADNIDVAALLMMQPSIPGAILTVQERPGVSHLGLLPTTFVYCANPGCCCLPASGGGAGLTRCAICLPVFVSPPAIQTSFAVQPELRCGAKIPR